MNQPHPFFTLAQQTMLLGLIFCFSIGALPSFAHAAEQAWMKGTLTAAIYSSPDGGSKKIVASISTGDRVTILQRQKNWTKIRMDGGKEGWVKIGYLKSAPPANVQLEKLQADFDTMREELGQLKETASTLDSTKEELLGQSTAQQAELEKLRETKIELEARIRAGERWPEMITGAAILAAGMFLQLILGAFVHWRASRRPTSRVRF